MTRTPAALPARDRYRSAADLAAVEPRPLPPLGSDERVGLPAPVWRSLPCGLRAVAVHDPHAATVEVQLLLPYTPATQRESALADLLADAVLRGAEHELRAGRTAEWFIVTAHAPSDELAGLLQDLTLALTGGSTPGDPVARARARLARRAAVPRAVVLLPERVERVGLRVRPPAAVLRCAARALPPLAPAFFAFFRAAGRLRATLALLPEPPFIPPPVSLFTVAQARASAFSSGTPRFS